MASVTEFPGFDVDADCKKLRNAMKGLGTDEKVLISVICYRSNSQRQQLKVTYKSMFGRDLVQDLKSELSGNFEAVMVGLMMTHPEFDAASIKKAVRGLGTDEAALIEVLCSRSQEQLEAMKAAYKEMYGKEMEKAVATDVSGDFKRLLVSLISARRDPDGPVDQAKVAADAQELYRAGEARWGTDEEAFNVILATRSYTHLRALYEEYEKISGSSMERAIRKEFSGDLEKAYIALIQCSKNRAQFFADQLYRSMKGAGTDEDTLTRIMVSRCEIDMEEIKKCFSFTYHKSLESFIKDDTSGDYERSLLALCRD